MTESFFSCGGVKKKNLEKSIIFNVNEIKKKKEFHLDACFSG